MDAIFLLICTILPSYFLACNYLSKQEAKYGSNEHSYLWSVWFAYACIVHSLLTIGWATYEVALSGSFNSDSILFLLSKLGLIISALFILRRNVLGWFIATTLTLNIIIWAFNAIYFFKVRSAFKKI